MKVLVVGAGGREHALCWSLAASPLVSELLCAPGSDAIAREARCVPLAVDDLDGIVAFCREREDRAGGARARAAAGAGPGRSPARRPASRPPGRARRPPGSRAPRRSPRTSAPATASRPRAVADFRRAEADGREGLRPRRGRADRDQGGRARRRQGRDRRGHASRRRWPRWMQAFGGAFGAAGQHGRGRGVPASARRRACSRWSTAATCSRSAPPRTTSGSGEGDRGPNTGGMGAYAPAPCMTPALTERAMAEIVRPTVAGLAAEGSPIAACSTPA